MFFADPCDDPTVTAVGLTNQEITITQDDYPDYTHPIFTIDPSYCPLTYTYTVSNLSNGNSAITGTSITDTATEIDKQSFSFYYDADITPVFPTAQTQTVQVTATSGTRYKSSPNTLMASATFALSFLNPCINTSYVTITAPGDLPPLSYMVAMPATDFAAHSAFTVTTTPLVGHTICGDLSYSA